MFSVFHQTTTFPPVFAPGDSRPEIRRRLLGTVASIEAARVLAGTVPHGQVDIIEGGEDVAARRVEVIDRGQAARTIPPRRG